MSEYTVKHDNSNYMILFGDSYTRLAFDPSGELPSRSNIIGNPAWPGASTSGGLNWATMLASQYNKSLTLVYAYAFGGATINNYIVLPPGEKPLVDFNDQFGQFKANLTKQGSPSWADPGRSLVGVWFGQNDVYELFNRSVSDPYNSMDQEFDDYFERLDDLYRYGARDFLFIGVSPMARSPLGRTNPGSRQAVLASMCDAFNTKLASRAQAFADTHAGIVWQYYDPAPAFNRVLDNPTKYGAPDDHCTNGDGVSCLWWNDIHPGLRIHQQVAADIALTARFSPLFKDKI